MSDKVSWILEVSIKPGKADEYRALMEDMVAASNEEPGTIIYEWHIADDGSTVHIHEGFVDSDATLVHLGGFGANFAERFMGGCDPTGFTVYGNPNAEVKGALEAMGPAYLSPYGGFIR